MTIQLPVKVSSIIHKLTNAGYEAYAVGGCVRDSILGKEPNDWDITTSALPQEVKQLFARTIDTGIEHGTVTVMIEKEGFEITTFRIDGEYEDSRHPKEVLFTRNLVEDLKRRDFTINAMAYNDEVGLVDAFDGVKDLEEGIIKCVGDPKLRFGEDALRIMRAIRFSAQLGYTIDSETAQAITELKDTLTNISAERIEVELVKLMVSDHPDYIKKAYELGVSGVFFPEFDRMMETKQNNPHHCYTVGEHTLQAVLMVAPDKVLRLAALFHDMGKPLAKTTDEANIDHFYGHAEKSEKIAKTVLKRLRFDNATIDKVCKIVRWHDYEPPLTRVGVRKAITKVGENIYPLLFQVKRADILAQSNYQRKDKLERLAKTEEIFHIIIEEKDCISLKMLAVSGKDLLEIGVKQGKEIGYILEKLFEIVLEDPSLNEKEVLLSKALEIKIKS